ncbi:MAG: hypothetical protein JWQ20_3796, partial [Conexibacter sp.]|nr:hypothetical protein [Conexibacter sp.]
RRAQAAGNAVIEPDANAITTFLASRTPALVA